MRTAPHHTTPQDTCRALPTCTRTQEHQPVPPRTLSGHTFIETSSSYRGRTLLSKCCGAPDSDPGQTCGTLVHLCRAVLDYHVFEIDGLHPDHGGIHA